MSYRLVETYSDDTITVAGKTLPSVCLVEDDDGMRLFVTTSTDEVPGRPWVQAHAAGACALVAVKDGRYYAMSAEAFIQGRGEQRSTGMFLPPTAWDEYGEPPTYRSMRTERVIEQIAPPPSRGTLVHLHAHSEYSALDGLARVDEMVAQAVADDQPAIAVTDHGKCAGHPVLQKEAKKAGIKPIFGIEAYFVADRLTKAPPKPEIDDKTSVDERNVLLAAYEAARKEARDYNHLILWAFNDEGLHNLWAMSTQAHSDGFYYVPRMDWPTLERYSEGVGMSTACIRGPLSRALLNDQEDIAVQLLGRFMNIFGDRLYIELHTTGLAEQKIINQRLVDLAQRFSVPTIAVVDSHYPCAQDHDHHKVWIAAQTNKDLQDEEDLFVGREEYHVMTTNEVRGKLAYLPKNIVDESIANTVAVAERCTATVKGSPRPPIYSKKPVPAGVDPNSPDILRDRIQADIDRLIDVCLGNWDRKVRGKRKPESLYMERFEYEMKLLIEKGFCFVAGTSITLADGTLRPVEQVQVGDEVVTRTGTGRVARTLVRTPDLTVKIDVAGSAWPLHTTPDHPLWVRGKDWTQAGEVQVGDYLAVGLAESHQQPEFDLLALAVAQGWRVEQEGGRFRRLGAGRWEVDRAKAGWCPERIVLDADWGYLLGLWLAEGHREVQGSNAGQVAWTLCAGEPAVERLTSTLARLGLGEARFYSKASASQPDHRGVTIKVTNHPLWLLLGELLGDGVRGKRLHPWLATAPADTTHALLAGWFDGDGTTKPSGRRVLDMVNPTLARQARQMLLRQGTWATTTRFVRADGVESYRVCWQVERTKKPYGALWADGRWWVRVTGTTEELGQEVYNLTVNGDPSYVAEDVVAHNCGYFMMVHEYVAGAKKKGRLVGPSRGSGGGSLVAYLADITEIDPIDSDLLFERFMTPGRKALPDFDIDFCASDRDSLQVEVRDRWGPDNVVRVGTVVRARNKGIVRSIAGVLDKTIDIHWPDVTAICKIIDEAEANSAGLGIKWETLIAEHGEVLEPYRQKYPRLFEHCDRLAGRVKTYSKHAAGLVISTDEPLTGRLPMRVAADDEEASHYDMLITEFDKDDIEELGLVKFDLLTLRTLDTLQMCIEMIEQRHGKRINVYDWRAEYEDQRMWDELSAGHTLGVFQIETRAVTKITKRMKPRNLHDLADVITLVRPGPQRSGLTDSYLNRREGIEQITYPDPRLETVLSRSYGTIIYQEDIMQTCMVLAGYDGEEADKVRKILGKKKVEEVEAEGKKFIPACVERGMDEAKAAALWDQMAEFAKYSFNRAHAYAYAVLACWTAWFKVNYPMEFFAALLSTVDKERIPEFVVEARRLGFKVLPPDINASGKGFRPVGTDTIRYGLDGVAEIGDAVVAAVTQGQPYHTFEDFLARKGGACNSKHVRILARIGAFDSLGENRRALESKLGWEVSDESTRCQFKDLTVLNSPNNLPCTFDWANEPVELTKTGKPKKRKDPPKKCTKGCRNYTAPEAVTFHDIEPYSDADIRDIEKEVLGVFLSSTPFDQIDPADRASCVGAVEVDAGPEGEYLIAAIVDGARRRKDRTGEEMAFLTLTTEDGKVDVACFKDNWRKYQRDLADGRLIFALIKKTGRGNQLSAMMPVA